MHETLDGIAASMVLAVTTAGLAEVVPGDTRAADIAAAERDMRAALAARSEARGYDAIVAAERAFMAAGERRNALRGA